MLRLFSSIFVLPYFHKNHENLLNVNLFMFFCDFLNLKNIFISFQKKHFALFIIEWYLLLNL